MSVELINIRTLALKPLLHLQQNTAQPEKKDPEIARLSGELKAPFEQNTATLDSKDQEIARLKQHAITQSKQYAKDIRDLKNRMQSQSQEHKNELATKSTVINLQYRDIQHKENTIGKLEDTIDTLTKQLIMKEKANGDLRSHIGDLSIELNELQTSQPRNPSSFFSSHKCNPSNKSTHQNNPHNNNNSKENLYKENITTVSK